MDLVGQTSHLMRGVEATLIRQGFGFADVVKSTAHYAEIARRPTCTRTC